MKMSMRKISNSSDVCWFFFEVAFVLSLVAVVIWLTLTPRNPAFSITGIHITSSKSFNSTPNYQNASLNFNLETRNPNKGFGIYYDTIDITFYCHEDFVGTNSTPGFYQGYKETSIQKMLVNAEDEIWKGISGEKVELRVAIETSVRYKIIIKKTKHHPFIFEGYVTVGLNGTIISDNYIKLHRRR